MTPTQSQIRDALADIGHSENITDRVYYPNLKGESLNTIRTILQSALDTQKQEGDAALGALDKLLEFVDYGDDPAYSHADTIVDLTGTIRAALAGKPKDGPVYTNAEFTINQHRQEIPVYDTLSGPVPDTAADTKMGDAVKALAAIENGTLVLDVMHTYECGSRHTGDCVCGAEENSKHITTIKKALSHDNAELGKVGEIFDKLTQYAEDSIGCQYGTLSADLVEKLAKEGLAIIDRMIGGGE